VAAKRVIVVGGGAAGFFAAIACARANPTLRISIFEKSPRFLSKVRISGGGRCNVTHACFDPRALAERYPRGEKELIGLFHRFQARDTVDWFENLGVKLKTETDGRIFPVSDSSQTVIECLVNEARRVGVEMLCDRGVEKATRNAEGSFELRASDGETTPCDFLLLAFGGCRVPAQGQLAVSLGHTLVPPVPSLFTFHTDANSLTELAGISVADVEVSAPQTRLRERGALLVTHSGLSGPVILRLSAWGARILHDLDYHFSLRINWLPESTPETIAREFERRRNREPAKLLATLPFAPLPSRLWQHLLMMAQIDRSTRWSALSRTVQHKLAQQLTATELSVTGKSLNKDEFVTCGGVPLPEVDFKTMQSRVCPRLYFAGEILDIDGITGGFNFQAAWTTGWLAGNAIASQA
jgi:predicted Rossmann fold flavoprotein